MLIGTTVRRYIFRLKRHFETSVETNKELEKRTLVIGAGEAGENIARESHKNTKI